MVEFSNPNPLTVEHLAQINDGLAGLANARKAIELAKRAGVDVAAQEATVNDTEAKLLRIKNTYFPNGVPV